MPEKSDRQLIEETHDAVIGIKTFLFGPEGQDGLASDFRKLAQSHYHLQRTVWCLIALLVGLGILSGISLLGGS
jgi:hypothetical protein